MISLKDYAKQKNVSYEAIRKQVKRYHEELQGHIIIENRTKFLDDAAIQFLDSKRDKNPVIIVEAEKNEKIEYLENENKRLLLKISELQDQLLQEKDNVKQLQQEKIELLEFQNQPKKKSWWFWKN